MSKCVLTIKNNNYNSHCKTKRHFYGENKRKNTSSIQIKLHTEENCIQKLNFHKYRLQLHDGAPSKADKVAYRRQLN